MRSPFVIGVRLMPIISGTFGPYTSASSKPTLWPSDASATARLTETVVLPTPPLPEPTAIRFVTPGMGSLGGCPGWLGVIRTYRSGMPERNEQVFAQAGILKQRAMGWLSGTGEN